MASESHPESHPGRAAAIKHEEERSARSLRTASPAPRWPDGSAMAAGHPTDGGHECNQLAEQAVPFAHRYLAARRMLE